jgi:2-iminobutanoate/2-iminopropanoate deaminase
VRALVSRRSFCYNAQFARRDQKEDVETVREIVATESAPQAIGPYSQAVKVGDLVFTSGQIPIDPRTGVFVEGGIAEQTEQVLRNLGEVLRAAGTSLEAVVKTTVYLADMNDFAAMNEVYARYFSNEPPARSTVQAARLPRDARVEIDVIAIRRDKG